MTEKRKIAETIKEKMLFEAISAISIRSVKEKWSENGAGNDCTLYVKTISLDGVDSRAMDVAKWKLLNENFVIDWAIPDNNIDIVEIYIKERKQVLDEYQMIFERASDANWATYEECSSKIKITNEIKKKMMYEALSSISIKSVKEMWRTHSDCYLYIKTTSLTDIDKERMDIAAKRYSTKDHTIEWHIPTGIISREGETKNIDSVTIYISSNEPVINPTQEELEQRME